MDALQESKLTMYRSVHTLCSNNPNAVNAVPAMKQAFSEFSITLDNINTATGSLRQVTTGIALEKEEKRGIMSQNAFTAANVLFAFASATGNTDLKKQATVSPRSFDRLRDEDVDDECLRIYKLAAANMAELPAYGYSTDLLDDFRGSIDNYTAMIEKPKAAKANLSGERKLLDPLFAEADMLLKERMDKIMVIYERTNPAFAEKYYANRVVNDPRTTHTQITGIVKDNKGMPVPEVRIEVKNDTFSGTVFTDKEGKYQLVLRYGAYELFASKAGHPDVALRDVNVKLGQISHVDIAI